MMDRLTIALRLTKGAIASVKALPGAGGVSYNGMMSVFADVAEDILGYRDEFIPRSQLTSEEYKYVLDFVKGRLEGYIEGISEEDKKTLQLLVMETASHAEILSRVPVATGDLEVPTGV